MNDDELRKIMNLEGTLAELLDTFVADKLSLEQGVGGLRWSPNMPDDDPDSELLVVDGEGVEYVLDIDVDLSPTGRKEKKP